jgi:hypothetical protein
MKQRKAEEGKGEKNCNSDRKTDHLSEEKVYLSYKYLSGCSSGDEPRH